LEYAAVTCRFTIPIYKLHIGNFNLSSNHPVTTLITFLVNDKYSNLMSITVSIKVLMNYILKRTEILNFRNSYFEFWDYEPK